MNIQKLILNLFPAHREVLLDLVVAKQETVSVHRIVTQLRTELLQVHAQLIDLLHEQQQEKHKNELSPLNLTNPQILKLISITGDLPEIQEELVRSYEKGIERKLQRNNRLKSE